MCIDHHKISFQISMHLLTADWVNQYSTVTNIFLTKLDYFHIARFKQLHKLEHWCIKQLSVNSDIEHVMSI